MFRKPVCPLHTNARRILIYLFFFSLSLIVAACTEIPRAPDPIIKTYEQEGGTVIGTVYAEDPSARSTLIPLARFEVYLRTGESNEPTVSTHTNARGRYQFPRQQPGQYKLCWQQPGWQEGCAEHDVVIDQNAVYLPPTVPVPLALAAAGMVGQNILTGQVRLDIEQPSQVSRNYLAQDKAVQVTTLDAAGNELTTAIQPNAWGQFIIPNVPADATQIRAVVEGQIVDQDLSASEMAVSPQPIDLPISSNLITIPEDDVSPEATERNRQHSPEDQIPQAGGYLDIKGLGSDIEANDYYRLVDPENRRKTLGDWWATNGFDRETGKDIAGDHVHVAYLSYNDLGLGRNMNCTKQGDRIACHVTNYGFIDQASVNADNAAEGKQANAGGTVAMEYSLIEGQDSLGPVVKFFAFDSGKQPSSERTTQVSLDNTGIDKYVPHLCLHCHGGNYFPGKASLGASFREFGTSGFRYPGDRTLPSQEENAAFRTLNEFVLATNPASGIRELITGWYDLDDDGDLDDTIEQNTNFIPPGWRIADEDRKKVEAQQPGSTQEDLYLQMVSQSCRSCHIAFEPKLNWATYQQFVWFGFSTQLAICDLRTMPHAPVPFKNFWLSQNPHQPKIFSDFRDKGDPNDNRRNPWPAADNCIDIANSHR